MNTAISNQTAIYLGSEPVEPIQPWPISVVNPFGGSVIINLVGGGKLDAIRAVDHAYHSMEQWESQSSALRSRVLHKIATALRDTEVQSELSILVSKETGKRISEAQAEINLSAAFFDWFGDAIAVRQDQLWEAVPGIKHEVHHQAIGVVGVITPWNFPVSIPARKIAAALAAGCSIVFKPSEIAPTSSLRFAEIISSYLPPGIVCTVVGEPISIVEVLTSDPRVKAITFTGSTRVGQIIAQNVAPNLKRTVLELGGSAPYLVLDDVNIEQSVATLMVAKYRNNGQSCIAANHAWVPQRFYDKFVEAFLKASEDLVLGDPFDPSTTLGPLCLPSDLLRISRLIRDAEESGTKVIQTHTGTLPDGNFSSPAVCLSPSPTAQIVQGEIFGPVISILPYKELDEAINIIGNIRYGLSGYISTNDLEQARKLARCLDIGIIGINTATPNTPQIPFSGRKFSGMGAEGGQLGLEEFLSHQTVAYLQD